MRSTALVFHSSFTIHHSSVPLAERSHSGLVHRSRKPEWSKGHRGFESHPLRHLFSEERHTEAGELSPPLFFRLWKPVGGRLVGIPPTACRLRAVPRRP